MDPTGNCSEIESPQAPASARHEPEDLYDHDDALEGLGRASSLNEKLSLIHGDLNRQFDFIARVAVSLYDEKAGLLKTFIASNLKGDNPLVHSEALLDHAPGLAEFLRRGRPRVVHDLSLFDEGSHLHTRRIRQEGYRASYTVPIHSRGINFGFIFFDSEKPGCFAPDVLARLDVHAHLIAEIVVSEIIHVRTMMAALKSASRMVHFHDPETGNHLERMARFARLIAQDLSRKEAYSLDDEMIERIYLFAPLHDVGKIAIPDLILLKPGRLNPEEFEVMKTHTLRGREIIDSIMASFGFENLEGVNLLRHIAEDHHETLDGLGYPHGLRGEEIPMEARIVAAADVFDALTSARPYKAAWSNDEAFTALKRMAESKLDRDCVAVLIDRRESVEEIQRTFRDEEGLSTPASA